MKFTTHTLENKHIDFDFIGLPEFLKSEKNINVYSINESKPTAIIDWQFYFESRSWGIKDIGAFVDEIINFDIDLTYYKTGQDEWDGIEQESFFDLTIEIKDFEIINEQHNNSDSVLITNIQVDFKQKQITINF